MLRAADRYAYTGCGSTAYSVGTVYGGKKDLYTPDARPALLATPRRFTGDAPSPHWRRPGLPHWRRPVRPVDDALLALLRLTTETRPTHNNKSKRRAGGSVRECTS